MRCQAKTAEIMRAESADYMLQVNDNQRNLHKEISAFFHKTYRDDPQVLETGYFQEIDKTHGRINERYYRLLPTTAWMTGMEFWQDIRSVVEVTHERTFKRKEKNKPKSKCLIKSALWRRMSKKRLGLSEIIGRSRTASIGCWASHLERMKARYMQRMGRKI